MRRSPINAHTAPRKRRAQRFRSTKELTQKYNQLTRSTDELQCLLDIAKQHGVSAEEGKEIIRLSNRIRRLKRKLGLEDSQENCGAQNIPS